MKLYFNLIICLFFLSSFITSLSATYSGNASCEFLKLNPDPKITAIAGSYLTKFPSINNPACLANLYQSKLLISHTEWAQDIKYSYLLFSSPFNFGNLGFGLTHLGYGKIQGIDMYQNEYSIPDSYDMLLTISYAKTVAIEIPVYKEFGSFGTNLKFIKSQLAEYSAEAVALDLGAVINIGLITGIEKIERLRTSFLYKNLGSKIKYVKKEYPLPAGFNFGLGIDFPNLKNLYITTSLDIPEKSNLTYSLGLSIEPIYFLSLRCGYKYTRDSISDGLTGGFGVNLGSLNFNYAFQQFREFSTLSDLGLTHQVSIELGLGSFVSVEIGSDIYLRKHLDTALEFYYKKEYSIARQKVNEILSLSTNYKPAQDLLKKIDTSIEKEKEKKEQKLASLLRKAKVSLDRKDFITAKKNYELVLQIEPENTEAKEGLGKIDQELAKIKQERIIRENAKKINRIWKEAVRYYKTGNFIKSKEKFIEIRTIAPEHEPTIKYLTEIEAQIAQLNAQQIDSLYLQATELFKKKKYLEAAKYFEAVLIAAPHRLDATDFLDKCHQAIKEEEERQRQEELAKLQEEHRKEMKDVFNTALKLYEKLDYSDSLKKFEEAKELANKYQFTEYLEKSNNYIETIKLALSDQHYKKGFQLYQQNRPEEAYREYSKSLEYNPNNVTVENELKRLKETLAQKYYELGISCYTRQELEKAKEYFRKSLSYMPDKEETIRALQRLE